MKIRKFIFLFLSLPLFFCCVKSSDKIEGDLYFGALRFGNFYKQPDSLVRKFKIYADTVNRKNLEPSDKEILETYEILKKENILYYPYIELKLDSGTVVKLYLKTFDYKKIKKHKRQQLQKEGKKVRIVAEVRNLGHNLFICNNVLNIMKTEGKTLQIQKKFQIEDYK
jgi:hypothetical protein